MKTILSILLSLAAIVLAVYLISGFGIGRPAPGTDAAAEPATDTALATFGGGCFWCMEPPFEGLEGVIDVVSGYTGGEVENPSYQQVVSGGTGHYEAVQVTYDPEIISYQDLLYVYWRQIDPTDAGGSFVDRGSQYRSAIFYHSPGQKRAAERSKRELDQSGRYEDPIVTEILPAETFYLAEEYHQDYFEKKTLQYKAYRSGSGRDQYIEQVWGDNTQLPGEEYQRPSQEDLKESLTDLQFYVTQQDGTEPAFQNEYWDNKMEGIYVDIVSGQPLFSSTDKFKSGTGWPSFTQPIEADVLAEVKDDSLGMRRVEVRSTLADSHLGHVFQDGPEPTGLRYCINSAALEFIPKADMADLGYGEYLYLFE